MGRYSARIADRDEGVTPDELRLAARNHGMPAEALRFNVTPPGLHYVLTHYDIPAVSAGGWRLTIGGAVSESRELDLFELQGEKSRTVRVTMECAGNGRARLSPRPISQPWLVDAVGTADWTGVPLRTLIDSVGISADALELVFTGADRGWERGVEQAYQRSLPLSEALADDVLVAYLMNGQPLPVQHGIPGRLVVPGWYGMAHVKWLSSIDAVTEPFTGFQNAVAYRLRQEQDDDGTPVSRIEPRAALIPPGVPDFMTRDRFVPPGPVTLTGRAWSGWAPITAVDISTDGGLTWFGATVTSSGPSETHAWQSFEAGWQAMPGEHQLMARATDGTGRVQPLDQPWNRGGFANNQVDAIRVIVAP